MDPVIQSLLSGAPVLLTHLLAAFALFGLAASIYMAITPMREMALIRAGNSAAAVSLGGGLLGIAIPLAACLSASVGILDLVVWGVVVLAIQLITLRLVDAFVGDLRRRIEAGEMASAVTVAAVKLSVAAITAAAIGG